MAACLPGCFGGLFGVRSSAIAVGGASGQPPESSANPEQVVQRAARRVSHSATSSDISSMQKTHKRMSIAAMPSPPEMQGNSAKNRRSSMVAAPAMKKADVKSSLKFDVMQGFNSKEHMFADDEEIEEFLEIARSMSAPKGGLIFEAGTPATEVYILVSGNVEIRFPSGSKGQVKAVDFFGESSFFADPENNVGRTADAYAESNCMLLALEYSQIRIKAAHNIRWAQSVMMYMGRRVIERFQQSSAASTSNTEDATLKAFSKKLISNWALQYHSMVEPGKLRVEPTMPCGMSDLVVAYSPGVAEPCLRIKDNYEDAYLYTTKGHMVAVISNGTAVLGLGDIGALAGKPVMEGKCVLFKVFGGLDSIDIEVEEKDPEKLVQHIVAISCSFGGINLEDIKAPECFYVEEECQKRCKIPVFHDDQHGTAVIAGAGLLNAMQVVGKDITKAKVVFSGAGAAGFMTARHFVRLGVPRENVTMTDINGVVYKGRQDLQGANSYLQEFARETPLRTLAEAIKDADVFVGLSAPNLLKPEMLLSMAKDPLVFALANPNPEIDPALAKSTRSDVVMATGRCDFPNQINNVLCFPYLFRGALDCRAPQITEEMKVACSRGIALVASDPGKILPTWREDEPTAQAFGREYILPKANDPRLRVVVPYIVAECAVQAKVASPSFVLADYKDTLMHEAIEKSSGHKK